MVPCVHTVLGCCVAVAAASVLACTPEEDPSPYVGADTPIATDNGQFTISLRAAEGRPWPEYIGPTAFAADIEVGAEPASDDPQFHGEEPERPFELEVGAARPRDFGAITTLTARTWPIAEDGHKWMVAVDFKTAGDWVFPLTVRDALGRSDDAEIVFHIEPRPQ